MSFVWSDGLRRPGGNTQRTGGVDVGKEGRRVEHKKQAGVKSHRQLTFLFLEIPDLLQHTRKKEMLDSQRAGGQTRQKKEGTEGSGQKKNPFRKSRKTQTERPLVLHQNTSAMKKGTANT